VRMIVAVLLGAWLPVAAFSQDQPLSPCDEIQVLETERAAQENVLEQLRSQLMNEQHPEVVTWRRGLEAVSRALASARAASRGLNCSAADAN
jgi:hypothetical protein